MASTHFENDHWIEHKIPPGPGSDCTQVIVSTAAFLSTRPLSTSNTLIASSIYPFFQLLPEKPLLHPRCHMRWTLPSLFKTWWSSQLFMNKVGGDPCHRHGNNVHDGFRHRDVFAAEKSSIVVFFSHLKELGWHASFSLLSFFASRTASGRSILGSQLLRCLALTCSGDSWSHMGVKLLILVDIGVPHLCHHFRENQPPNYCLLHRCCFSLFFRWMGWCANGGVTEAKKKSSLTSFIDFATSDSYLLTESFAHVKLEQAANRWLQCRRWKQERKTIETLERIPSFVPNPKKITTDPRAIRISPEIPKEWKGSPERNSKRIWRDTCRQQVSCRNNFSNQRT